MKYLDLHVHFNSEDPVLIQKLADTARRLNTGLCLSGGLGYGGHDMVPNDTVLRCCKSYADCFFPLAKVNMGIQTDTPEQIFRYAEQGFKALKCIYPWYEYDHDLYMPLYEAAETCGLPILFHTGNYRPSKDDIAFKRPVLKNMNPLNLDRIARSFQKLPVIMAHLGTSVWRREAAEYLKIHDNLYADLAGNGAWQGVSADDLVALLRPEVQRIDPTFKNFTKIVFGTDSYVTNTWALVNGLPHYQALLNMCNVPENIRRKILGGTVAGWLGIKLDD